MRKATGALLGMITSVGVLFACSHEATTHSQEMNEVTIGYQKNAITLMLREDEQFHADLEALGYSVDWAEFNTGSSTLEALGTESVDIANAGDIPSLYAIANNHPIRYIASTESAPHSQGILVQRDTDIEDVGDLEGKRIAFNRASIAHYLTLKTLEQEGLNLDDVRPVYLDPPDAILAMERGEIDAWVVWDPYLAAGEERGHEVISTSEDVVAYRSFYFTNEAFLTDHPEALEVYVDAVIRIGEEVEKDPSIATPLLFEETGLSEETWHRILDRGINIADYNGPGVEEDLQQQADDLLELGFIDDPLEMDSYIVEGKELSNDE
ncbi:LOW QUALITY PROTEIN: alkanesulfonates-binding protein [Geomicrobium sp. JCM 19055]|nr:LOW QUALITY PROTEIN: alkanesulfonates-binding protein [Geomicrobium sp. JCM 19055]